MDDTLEKVLKIMEILRSMETDALARLPTPTRADFHLLLQRWVYASAQDLTFEEEVKPRPLTLHVDVFGDNVTFRDLMSRYQSALKDLKERQSKDEG